MTETEPTNPKAPNDNVPEQSAPQTSQTKPEPTTADAKKLKLGWIPILISVAAFCVSLFSLSYNLGYIRPHEDHDVVARVLGVNAFTKGFSSIVTNGELSVDLAFINKGNQTEIIREVFLCYSDSKDFGGRGRTWQRDNPQMNVQMNKGEKRVLHLSTLFNSVNTGRRLWLGLAVRAIAPNADDVEVVWPVCEINLPADGNGSWVSYNKDQTPLIQIISHKRMPHQRLAPDGF